MNFKQPLNTLVTYFIALVWLINGLFCKVLNLVPRHRLIVAKISGTYDVGTLTKAIGIAEILMALWVVSHIKSRLCAIVQIVVVATMNVIEFSLAPGLLLFGKWNAFFACLFITIIYSNEFLLPKKAYLLPYERTGRN